MVQRLLRKDSDIHSELPVQNRMLSRRHSFVRSSVAQSTGLLSRGSRVRVAAGALHFLDSFSKSAPSASVTFRQNPSLPFEFAWVERVGHGFSSLYRAVT